MLDQNTDRMWYVIGAVIVGAALIFLMNGTFPTLFANIGDTFEDKVEDTQRVIKETIPSEQVDGAKPVVPQANLIAPKDLATHRTQLDKYDPATHTYTLTAWPASGDGYWWSQGLTVINKNVVIPYGEAYTLSYEIFVPEGPEKMFARDDVNNYPLDGSAYWGLSRNDNDLFADRTFNGTKSVKDGVLYTEVDRGEWTKIWITYYNTASGNVHQKELYDATIFGLYNSLDKPIQFKIRNVKGELHDKVTPFVPAS